MSPFSVVIPWKDRTELARTLGANTALFNRHGAQVVVVNCGGDSALLSSLLSDTSVEDLSQVFLPHAAFNKSLANNIGTLCCQRPFVFFLDADVILATDIFAEARPSLEEQKYFVNIHRVRESAPDIQSHGSSAGPMVHTERIVGLDGRQAVVRMFKDVDGSRWAPGLLLVNRAHLVDVGGFNAAVRGWGYEDVDLLVRLQLMLGLVPLTMGDVVHLTHGDAKRSVLRASRGDDLRHNWLMCTDNYKTGKYRGTYDTDSTTWGDTIERRSPR